MATLEEAKAMIEKLEERLNAVEERSASSLTENKGAVDNEALKAYQRKMLVRLIEIRDALGDGDSEAMKKERDEARAENVRLNKELGFANYRIKHLIRELNKSEEEVAAAKANKQVPEASVSNDTTSTAASDVPTAPKSSFGSYFGFS